MAEAFSAGEFRRRAQARFRDENRREVGDHVIDPKLSDFFQRIERRPAAVLVPIMAHEPEATVLFTERTRELSSHGGQIAFPGGKVDAADESAEAAALREAREEIGLRSGDVEIIGRAHDYLTGSGFHIVPVLGLVVPDASLTLNRHEVADAFEVPLSFLMNPANHHRGRRMWNGMERTYFEMPYQERYIWGITAGILRLLYEELYGDSP